MLALTLTYALDKFLSLPRAKLGTSQPKNFEKCLSGSTWNTSADDITTPAAGEALELCFLPPLPLDYPLIMFLHYLIHAQHTADAGSPYSF